MRELSIDIVNQTVALLYFLVESIQLTAGQFGVLLGFGQIGIQFLDFSLQLGSLLLQLFFRLRLGLRRHDKRNSQHKQNRCDVFFDVHTLHYNDFN